MVKFKVGDKVRVVKLYETDELYTKLKVGVEGVITVTSSIGDIYGVEFYYPLVEGAKFDLFGTAYHMYSTQLEKVPVVDMVNHPSHYTMGKYEVIDVIEDWKLSYPLGNAVKYIARSEYKGNKVQDLEKAIFYIKREIKKLEGGK